MSNLSPEGKIILALTHWTNRTGAQLSEMTGPRPSWLYPALMKMERDGAIESRWDDTPYPRLRRYKISERPD